MMNLATPTVLSLVDEQDNDNDKAYTVTTATTAGIVYCRDDECPLQYDLIRKVLEFIHDHIRFTLTRHGLGDANELAPTMATMMSSAIYCYHCTDC